MLPQDLTRKLQVSSLTGWKTCLHVSALCKSIDISLSFSQLLMESLAFGKIWFNQESIQSRMLETNHNVSWKSGTPDTVTMKSLHEKANCVYSSLAPSEIWSIKIWIICSITLKLSAYQSRFSAEEKWLVGEFISRSCTNNNLLIWKMLKISWLVITQWKRKSCKYENLSNCVCSTLGSSHGHICSTIEKTY